MKKNAFLFPGQGAQYVGMGKSFYENFSCFRQTIEEASDLLSFDFKKLIFAGSEKTLSETKYAQPSIFLISIATLKVLEKQFPQLKPSVCAGLSLGEYSALVAAKKILFSSAISLVQKRAVWMGEACEKYSGSMSAVIGLNVQDVQDVLSSSFLSNQVWVANLNTPDQIVISGNQEGLKKAEEKLLEKGAKKILPLKVEGAFHSGLMESAQKKLEKEIQKISFMQSPIDVVMNTTGDYVEDIAKIKSNLIQQVTHSVYWQKSIQSMEKEHINVFLEIGPSHTLTKMNRKMQIKGAFYFLDKVQDLDKLAEELF